LLDASKLSATKRALLESALRGRPARTNGSAPIPRRSGGTAAPLSIGQEQVWFFSRLSPEMGVYNEGATIQKRGRTDLDALRRAFNEIVCRHEIWRTTFPEVGGAPVQTVHPPGRIDLPLTDLTHLPAEEREAEAVRLATIDARRPYDLATGPLVRPLLVRLAEDDHRIYLAMHHIVFDGVSLYRVLLPELIALYDARAGGHAPDLAAPPIQYADFAEWQQRTWGPAHARARFDYWREHLAGELPAQLPTDHERPPVQRFRGAIEHLTIDGALVAELKELAHREGASLFMVLAAAFTVLLQRYSGQDDIVFGTPIDGRGRPELQSMIGYCLNAVVLRADASGDPGFRELLARVRDLTLAALANEVPFDRMVRELQPERDPSRNPFFQVMFGIEPPTPPVDPDWALRQMDVGVGNAKFDLYLEQDERPEGHISCRFVYNTDLFEPATIARMAEHWSVLLAGIAADPERPVSRLPLLAEHERHRLLVEWNATEADIPGACAHELFEAQARRTPSATAAVHGDERVSYRELDARANRLAHHLRGLGVGPDALVGLCVERSLDMLVGALAIMKAGGAYVPLDPHFPADRLTYMLEDSGAAVLVTQQHLAGLLPAARRVVRMDADAAAWAGLPDATPESGARPEHLAYAIYTSGSTGRPKGVQIPHRALVNFLCSMAREPGLGGDDVLLAVTTLSFDIAGLELYLPLVRGARVVIASAGEAADGRALAELMRTSGATIMQATPATWRMLVESGWEGAPDLVVLCGGEALPPDLAADLLGRCARLYNVYGPTETTIWSALTRLERGQRITLGRPLANTQLLVLDRHGQLVPIGVPGELCIGGAGLARGYRNRPDLTAERFVPSPLAPGERLYRTGDEALVAADGMVEYLGRLDQQVKVRGFRIELGEIESALAGQPGVVRAAVAAREYRPGDRRLVAYVVAADPAPTAAELRAALRATLPEYMVPGAFVFLDRFPLTPNGKLDRRALPAPEAEATRSAGGAPRTAVEESLVEIWAGVLGADRVGIEDDFFELGGHSLLGTRLVSRVRDAFAVDLPLRAVFEARTVAAMAELVEVRRQRPVEPAPPVRALRPDGPAQLSFSQQRLWFLDQLEPDNRAYHLPLAMRLEGALDEVALLDAVNEVVRRHEVLRTTYAMGEGHPVQVVAPRLAVTPERHDLRALPAAEREREVARIAAEVTGRRFDLGAGPVLRAALLALGDTEHVLVLNVHHIAADGWSMRVLLDELEALYGAFAETRPTPLPEPAIQYADYALWQRQRLSTATMAAQVAHWKERLAGLPTLELPTDRPRPPLQSYRGDVLRTRVPADLVAALKRVGREEGCTLFMAAQAAFDVLLARYSGQDDIAVGTIIAGRSRPETEPLIGLIANTLVLRTDLAGAPSFRELLRRVRSATLDAHQYQDVPFDVLVEELRPTRDLSRNPLFQILFTMDEANRAPELTGLRTSFVEMDWGASRVDLSVFVWEDERGLDCRFEYSTDLFDAATIARMAGHWHTLLAEAAADPDRAVGDLPLLPAAEREELLVARNATAAPIAPVTAHGLFEAQVARTPDAVAAAFEAAEQLTYAELDARANRLAHHLVALGVAPDALVGLCVERSLDMLVGALAILKAGGAYVPLDPRYPADRIAYMLQDSGARVLLTQAALEESLPAGVEHVVRLDADAARWAELPATPPEAAAGPEHLAYAIYTSGSTGRPKGVEIPHRALVNFLATMAVQPGLTADDVLLAVTTLSFDIAGLELYLPLTRGGRVVLAGAETALDGVRLAELMAATGTTVMQATPATWRMLVDSGWRGRPGLTALCGGEPLPRELAEELLGRVGSLWNMYGPTETTIWSTVARVERDAPITIGRPIANTEVYVLDRRDRPVPVGVAGELCIGGAGLARGYHERPELTAARFVPNPFGPGRIYRTGDLARWRADGALDCLGRLDDQVKVRGHRIELGEVETALTSHPGIAAAVAVAREERPGERRLVAYLIPASPEAGAPAPADLREHLRGTLPEYMVPSAFVTLDAFPLTANGKVDRRALPEPEAGSPGGADGSPVAPRTPTEEALAQIWAASLGLPQVGVRDSFFDLGGHSLLAVRAMAEVERVFGRRPPLASFFREGVTIEGQARLLEQGIDAGASTLLVRARPTGSRPPLFFVYADESALLSLRHFLPAFGPEQPVYGLLPERHQRRFDRRRTVEDLARDLYTALREVQPTGPYYVCGHSFGGVVAYELAAQLRAAGETVGLLAIIDSMTPDAVTRALRRWMGPRARLGRQMRRSLGAGVAKLWEVADREARGALSRLLRSDSRALDDGEFDLDGAIFLTQRYQAVGHDVPLAVFRSPLTESTDGNALGWEQLHRGPLECCDVPGDHLSMLQTPNVSVLADLLAGRLRTAQERD
jgi:amino acid adenylation domain-containing protein